MWTKVSFVPPSALYISQAEEVNRKSFASCISHHQQKCFTDLLFMTSFLFIVTAPKARNCKGNPAIVHSSSDQRHTLWVLFPQLRKHLPHRVRFWAPCNTVSTICLKINIFQNDVPRLHCPFLASAVFRCVADVLTFQSVFQFLWRNYSSALLKHKGQFGCHIVLDRVTHLLTEAGCHIDVHNQATQRQRGWEWLFVLCSGDDMTCNLPEQMDKKTLYKIYIYIYN